MLPNSRGGYSFLKGISPYSGGVVAANGFAIEHVRLSRRLPWKAGFDRIDAHLRAAGRPRQALCAIALRSPKPFSFGGFNDFNAGYAKLLEAWELLVQGLNPIARTNVAPESDPPAEPSLYSFAYSAPSVNAAASFVVSGAGELPEGSLDPHDVVRAGERSPEALKAKARFVLGLMSGRLQGLGVNWDDVTHTNVYTVHDVNVLLATEILPRMGRAREHGITWHYARPPIVSVEYEMDLRGCRRDVVIGV
jgi:hypothetical protein